MKHLKTTLLSFGLLSVIFILNMIPIANIARKSQSSIFSKPPQTAAQTMTLYQATTTYSSLVSVEIRGSAGYYGDCIEIEVEQKTATDVTINVEMLTKLIPLDSDYQMMIISKSQTISLTYQGHIQTVSVYGFCAQMHKTMPTASITFTVSSTLYSTSSNVGKVLAYLQTNTSYLSKSAGQCAIWACTDGPTEVDIGHYGFEDVRIDANAILAESNTGLEIPRDTIGENQLLSADFESDDASDFPSGWEKVNSGEEIIVVDSVKHSGSKSLKLEGKSSSKAEIKKSVSISTDFEIDYYIYIPKGGLDEENVGGIGARGFGISYEYDNSDGSKFQIKWGTKVYATSISTNSWHHIEIKCDLNNKIQEVVLDGKSKGTQKVSTSTSSYIWIKSGEESSSGAKRTNYVDDINVLKTSLTLELEDEEDDEKDSDDTKDDDDDDNDLLSSLPGYPLGLFIGTFIVISGIIVSLNIRRVKQNRNQA